VRTVRKQIMNRITVSGVKYMPRTAGYTKWDPKTNEIKPLTDYVQKYHRKWKEHGDIMNTGIIIKQILLSA